MSVGVAAFDGCKSLTSITIPNSLTNIGYKAFDNCFKLSDVWYGGSSQENIKIGNLNSYLTKATWHYNTCNTNAHVYYKACDADCNNCEWQRTEIEHSYSNCKADADTHWKECECGDKTDIAQHSDANHDGICDICEYNVGFLDDPDDPYTGDTSNKTILVLLLCISGMFALVTLFYRKKIII